jgi:diadenosine tetraphosphate (Ap4A) HIT family hydrolase
MITPEQEKQLKEQLLKQIESTFPEDKKQPAIQQVNSMTGKPFEDFLIQNKILKEDGQPNQQCIFCSIVSGGAQSYKIDENDDAIAILELNPISKGHIIVIPKEHVTSEKDIPKPAVELAAEIVKKIKSELKPKDVTIKSTNLFGHEMINILPVYDNETLESEKKQATPEELSKLQNQLEKKQGLEKVKKQAVQKITSKKLWLPKRIP